MRMMRRDPELASLRRRACAGGVDATCLLGGVVVTVGGMLAWDKLRDTSHGAGLESALKRWAGAAELPRWRRARWALGLGTAVAERNWRSPGMRLMGIHRADARTGGPVTVRSALIRHLVGSGISRLVSRRLLTPRLERQQAELQGLQADVDAARRQHPDDPHAQQRAIMEVYQGSGVGLRSCCWIPVVFAVINDLIILFTPRHQSPADWAAGVVVVRH
jgi:uncharacterized RDD family membrane protein YckC